MRRFVVLALSCATLIAATKKHDILSGRLKKTVSLLRPQDSSTYTYNDKGQIMTHNTYWPEMQATYKYSRKQVISRGEGAAKGHPITDIFYLEKHGRADSMKRMMGTDTFCAYFKYDKEGFETEQYEGCLTRQLNKQRIIRDGNIVQEIFYEDGKAVQTGYFDYYTDKPTRASLFGQEQLGFSFRGRDSRNLLKKLVMVRSDHDTILVNTPNYHFDEQGRITTVAIYGKSGALADSVQYFY